LTNATTDATLEVPKNAPVLDSSLRKLWEQIRSTAEVIQQLRQENRALKNQVEALGSQVVSLQREMEIKEQDMKRMKAERTQLIQAGSNNGFTDEEKEILKSKIKELIAKINSHL
jgi:chromosome segregation ATPase